MPGGTSYEEAHAAAFAKYGISPFAVYAPEVISQFPGEFGPGWRSRALQGVLGDVGMIRFDLGRWCRATVWLEALEPARFVQSGSVGQVVPVLSSSPAVPKERCVAVELVVPRGARVEYGLLGACFVPAPDRGKVSVAVDYSDHDFGAGEEFGSQIAVAPESPVVGLPKELADPVLAGAVAEIGAGWEKGPGGIRFSFAAHGAYGSGPRVFSLLGRLVVMVLRSPSTEMQVLEGLLTAALSG